MTIQMKNPSHPGAFIRIELIEAYNMTVTEGAKVLGVTRQALSTLLNEHASLSPEMALRVEKAFDIKMDTLLRMQTAYDIAAARAQEKKIKVRRYVPSGSAASST